MQAEIHIIHARPGGGDVRRPLRLLLSGGAVSVWAEADFAEEAERIACDPACFTDVLGARMAAEGYVLLPRTVEPIARFCADSPPCPRGEAVRIDSPALPTALLHPTAELAAAIAARGVMRKGRLVSAAWAMPDLAVDGTTVEIALETAPAFRRRGYAAASAAALIADLLAEGRVVVYRCAEGNRASLALAESLGLRRVGTEYAPAFRRRSAK